MIKIGKVVKTILLETLTHDMKKEIPFEDDLFSALGDVMSRMDGHTKVEELVEFANEFEEDSWERDYYRRAFAQAVNDLPLHGIERVRVELARLQS